MDTNWYVIQVIRGKEEQTASLCRNRIPSTILEECFIPKYKMKKKYEGAWHEIVQTLFPGYLFMISNHVELLNNELKKIPDFTKLLGNDGHEIYPLRKISIGQTLSRLSPRATPCKQLSLHTAFHGISLYC